MIINTYNYTITKTKVNEYSLTSPADLSGTTNPEYNIYYINKDNSITLINTQAIVVNTTYTIALDEGVYLLQFTGHHASNEYYTILFSTKNLQSCLLKIHKNLSCADLCNDCADYDWCREVVILLTMRYYYILLNHYFSLVAVEADEITSILELTDFSDLPMITKLAYRLGIYCDNCLKQPCGC